MTKLLLMLCAMLLGMALRLVPRRWLKVGAFTALPSGSLTLLESEYGRIEEFYAAIQRGCDLAPLYLSCLHRSLVACVLLRVLRYPAVLCLGVKKLEELFEAHAWIRIGERSYGEVVSEPHSYTELRK